MAPRRAYEPHRKTSEEACLVTPQSCIRNNLYFSVWHMSRALYKAFVLMWCPLEVSTHPARVVGRGSYMKHGRATTMVRTVFDRILFAAI